MSDHSTALCAQIIEKLDIASIRALDCTHERLHEIIYGFGLDLFVESLQFSGKISILPNSRFINYDIGTQYILEIVGADKLTVAPSFGVAECIRFVNCPNLVDVSALHNKYMLSFASCNSLADISCLQTIPILIAKRCRSIKKIETAGAVDTWIIHYCPSVESVVINGEISLIDISLLPQLYHIESRGIVKRMKIKDVYTDEFNRLDFSDLAGVKHLEISNVGYRSEYQGSNAPLTGIGKMKELESIVVFNCVVDTNDLAHLTDVQIAVCHWLEDVTPLADVQSLQIKDCNRLRDVSSLCNVPSLELVGLLAVDTPATVLNGVKDLRIYNCPSMPR